MANDGTVKIGVDVDEKEFQSGLSKLGKAAKGAMSGLEKEAQKNVSSLKELNRALELNPKNTELLIEKQKLLQSAVSTATEKAHALNSALEDAKASGMAEKNAEAYRKLVIDVSNAEAEAKQFQDELESVNKELSDTGKNVDEVADSFDDAEKKSGGFLSALSKIGKAAGVALGAATAAISAGAVGVGKLAASSIEAYSDFEQLKGGVETLFKESSATVMEYANNAYKTAGLSANEYMDTVTSFSASLLQGLGGDTEKAAQIADKAIVDMADNANKMGTDMASIQYAYQGFAKQNYTMLDNLKLGYGGTQAEMARLINDSGVLGDTMQVTAQTVNQVSFDKIIEAIHVVQERIGITGTTAQEASETIQGSVNAMKAAWQNFIAGMADGGQDIGQLTQNLVDSVLTVADNLVPRLQELLPRLAEGLGQLAANLLPYIPPTLETLLPALIDGSTALFTALASTLPALISTVMRSMPPLIDAAMEILAALGTGIMDSLPELLEAGVQIIVYLAEAIADALPELIPAIVEAIMIIVETLTQPDNLSAIINAALSIMLALAEGLIAAIPVLIDALPQIIENIIAVFVENAPKLLEVGATLLTMLADGLIEALPHLLALIPNLIEAIVQGILNGLSAIKEAGGQLFENFTQGFMDKVQAFIDKVKGIVDSIIGIFTGDGGNFGGSSSGGGATRPRARMAAMPANETDGNSEEGASITASAFSRASAIRALESAIPNVESRVALANASMAPAAGYSAPPPVSTGGGGSGGNQQAPIILRPNWTIQFQGDMAQLGRVLEPVIKDEDRRLGPGV